MFQKKAEFSLVFNDRACLIIILLFSFAAVAPMILLGVPDGDKDFPQHLQFAAAYYKAIIEGDFLPVWSAPDNYGFGSIGVRVYPPLASFLLASAKILSGNWFDAIWLSFYFWLATGGIGVYFLAKEWLSPKYSVAAAALYVILPYHLLQLYQMWLLAESAAAAVIPFCFLFLTRIVRREKLSDTIFFAIFFALLILTHIPSTIIGSISLAIYALFIIDRKRLLRISVRILAALAAGLLASSFYWVKVVTEINWIKASDPQFSSGEYDPRQSLFPIFFSVEKRYLERVLWHFDVVTILTFCLFLLTAGLLFFSVRKNKLPERKAFFALAAVGLFACFMISAPSGFVWQSISVLKKIQFPWRWLTILNVAAAMTFALAISQISSFDFKLKKISTYLILSIIVAIFLFDVTQNIFQSEPISRTDFEQRSPELFEETGCPCWWTKWADAKAFEKRERVFAGKRDIRINLWNATDKEFIIDEGRETDARIAVFYYPYWQAQVNGQTVAIRQDDDGSILIPLGNQKSLVKLYFQETFALSLFSKLSLFVWVLLFAVLIVSFQIQKKEFLIRNIYHSGRKYAVYYRDRKFN